jgi:hypothetical protein
MLTVFKQPLPLRTETRPQSGLTVLNTLWVPAQQNFNLHTHHVCGCVVGSEIHNVIEVERSNMLKFFNRSSTWVTRQLPCPALLQEDVVVCRCEPIPVPEVVEGHEDADWRLWVSAVLAQSQAGHAAQVSDGGAPAKGRHRPASIADYVRLDWYRDH